MHNHSDTDTPTKLSVKEMKRTAKIPCSTLKLIENSIRLKSPIGWLVYSNGKENLSSPKGSRR
jgi:hypothetical protein